MFEWTTRIPMVISQLDTAGQSSIDALNLLGNVICIIIATKIPIMNCCTARLKVKSIFWEVHTSSNQKSMKEAINTKIPNTIVYTTRHRKVLEPEFEFAIFL